MITFLSLLLSVSWPTSNTILLIRIIFHGLESLHSLKTLLQAPLGPITSPLGWELHSLVTFLTLFVNLSSAANLQGHIAASREQHC